MVHATGRSRVKVSLRHNWTQGYNNTLPGLDYFLSLSSVLCYVGFRGRFHGAGKLQQFQVLHLSDLRFQGKEWLSFPEVLVKTSRYLFGSDWPGAHSGEWTALIGLGLGHVLHPELGVVSAALESHGLRRDNSLGFSKRKIGHRCQKRVNEFWILKMMNKKDETFISYLFMGAVPVWSWISLFLTAPGSLFISAWYNCHCQGDASSISEVFLSPFANTQLYFQNLIINTVEEKVGGVYFWQSDVSILHIWLIRNLARNSSLYSFGNPGLDHKSLNQALSTSFNFKLSFCLPYILPEGRSHGSADMECPVVSSHWDSPQACGEVNIPMASPVAAIWGQAETLSLILHSLLLAVLPIQALKVRKTFLCF